jgi:hypothetical protein
MCAGAILGLVGTIPIPWILYLFLVPAVPAAVAFVLVLLLGLAVFHQTSRSRMLATAGLWLSSLGGIMSVGIIWFAGSPNRFSDIAVALGSIAVLSMPVSVTGASLARRPETELGAANVIDRNRLVAFLVCAGAAVGLVGSAPTGFTFLVALFSGFCFTLAFRFGVALFQKRRESRALAAASLYFALLGGGADILFPPLGLVLHGSGAAWLIAIGPIGMVIAGTGAVIGLRRGCPR